MPSLEAMQPHYSEPFVFNNRAPVSRVTEPEQTLADSYLNLSTLPESPQPPESLIFPPNHTTSSQSLAGASVTPSANTTFNTAPALGNLGPLDNTLLRDGPTAFPTGQFPDINSFPNLTPSTFTSSLKDQLDFDIPETFPDPSAMRGN